MRLAVSNIGFAPEDAPRVYALMQELGFAGLEIAPSLFVGEKPYEKQEQAAELARQIEEQYGLHIVSMQSIWYGQSGSIFEPQEARALEEYTRKACDFAAAVGCGNLVFGCPKNRVVPDGQAPDDALDFFTRIAAYAHERGTRIALEANPVCYGTNFCNTSGQALAFAARVPHLHVNYDIGTVIFNEEALCLQPEQLALINHIHISEPGLAAIEQRALHGELAQALHAAEYAGAVSIEMKTQPFDTLERVLRYVAGVFQ